MAQLFFKPCKRAQVIRLMPTVKEVKIEPFRPHLFQKRGKTVRDSIWYNLVMATVMHR